MQVAEAIGLRRVGGVRGCSIDTVVHLEAGDGGAPQDRALRVAVFEHGALEGIELAVVMGELRDRHAPVTERFEESVSWVAGPLGRRRGER